MGCCASWSKQHFEFLPSDLNGPNSLDLVAADVRSLLDPVAVDVRSSMRLHTYRALRLNRQYRKRYSERRQPRRTCTNPLGKKKKKSCTPLGWLEMLHGSRDAVAVVAKEYLL